MKLVKVSAVVLATIASLGITSARDASACGMSVRLAPPKDNTPSPVQEIARAEKALEAGANVAAAKSVLATFPRIRSAQAGANPLETRGLRVFALAIVRSDGAVDEKKAGVASAVRGAAGADESRVDWTPHANLEWAVQALREIDQKRPNDPTVQADLGEALASLPHGQKEALDLLSKLAQKDLMGSPRAYAALAKLRSQSGDAAGAEAAIKRCEEMSRTPGVCKVAPKAAAKA